MPDPQDKFHLAIPCHDLDAAAQFYVGTLGCQLGRRYDDRVSIGFFGHQIVCHLAPDKVDAAPEAYPRHFGMTFRNKSDFDTVVERVQKSDEEFFQEPSVRFPGRRESHDTFFLKDPSNNILEFKYYHDPAMMI